MNTKTISAKISDDLNNIITEICRNSSITRTDFLKSAIENYISYQCNNGIPRNTEPDTETAVYSSTTDERTPSNAGVPPKIAPNDGMEA